MKHVLVVGSGSVGKRHAHNLAELGCRISAVDPRADRREEIAAETPMEHVHTSLDEALAMGGLDGMVVATPTALHVEHAMAGLRARLPVLLEKPVSTTLNSALRLKNLADGSQVPMLLGYTWRWWPALNRLRDLLVEQELGPLRFARFHMSAHLADWHPWERYQDFFMASRAQGGGALLDESHWLDVMVWLFGPPRRLFAGIDHLSSLEIDGDDCVDMIAWYDGGLRVTVHLDLFGRPHEKTIQIVGEQGTLAWSALPNAIALGRSAEPEWETETFPNERNEMFMAVAREFVEVMDGAPVRTCTLDDGIQVMQVIEAARRSQTEGAVVTPGDWRGE